MRHLLITIVICSIIVSFTFETAAIAQPIGQIASQFVYLRDSGSDTAKLAGSGIALAGGTTSPKLRDDDGLEVTWNTVRDVRGPLGHRHVFYRQYLNTTANGPIELFGSEVGVHYGQDGAFARVAGRQFTAVTVANAINFPAGEAQRRAIERLASSQLFRPSAYDAISMGMRLYRDSHTTLALFSRDGTSFRYVYRTIVGAVTGGTFEVFLDAGTGDVLATESADRNNNCVPTTPVQSYSAQGYSVRPGFATRSLVANYAADRPTPFLYEGLSTASPRKLVFQQTISGQSAFACTAPTTQQYTLFPVATVSSVPTYDGDEGQNWGGRAAGDALYRTTQTMNAFASMGRNGWDGVGGDAQIVIRSYFADGNCQSIDSCGTFKLTPGGDNQIPPGGAVLASHPRLLYDFNASLDQVAHEWGHGVIATTCNLSNGELNEGFADVIGQMVEKLTEPAGSGIEQSSDWDLGEDLKKPEDGGNYLCAPAGGPDTCYFYSGTKDDGTGHTFGAWTLNNRLHIGDEPTGAAGHNLGNMLNVTYKLLSDGGKNAICDRLTTLSGCDVTVSAMGITTASNIMFDTIQWYLPSSAGWPELAYYASLAAFDRYNQCVSGLPGHNAAPQQGAVDKAFGAIGYPRTTPAETCQ